MTDHANKSQQGEVTTTMLHSKHIQSAASEWSGPADAVQDRGTGKTRSSTKILAVDTVGEFSKTIGPLMMQEGYVFEEIAHSMGAVQRASHTHYAAALLNVSPLGKDGISLVRDLKTADPGLPLIVFLQEGDEGSRSELLPQDTFASLTASCPAHEVIDAVRRATSITSLQAQVEHVEQALLDSQERFHAVVQLASDAIILADQRGIILFWNKAAQTLFQYSKEEVVGEPLTMIMPERYREPHEKGLKRLATTGHSTVLGRTIELHGLKKDGTEFPLELSLSTWRNREDIFFTGILRDITERKRVEEALRASEERLELAVQGSNDGLWDLRACPNEPWYSPRTSMWFSPTFKQMLGFKEEEFEDVVNSWASRLHSEDKDRVFAALEAHIVSKEPYDVEYRLQTKQGEYRWFRSRGKALWTDTGILTRISGSLQCITDRKRVEQALRQADDRYHGMVENAVEGIFQTTPDGRFLSANPSMARMLGYASPGELIETVNNIESQLYVHPERRQELKHALDKEGLVRGFEAQLYRKDGRVIWVSVSARAVHAPSNAWRHYEGTAVDITERKRDAERLTRINDCFLRFGKDSGENIHRLTALCGELFQGTWSTYSYLEGGMLHSIGLWQTPPGFPPVAPAQGQLCSDVIARGGDRMMVDRHLQESAYADTDPYVNAYGLKTHVGQAVRRGGRYIGSLCVVFRRDFVPTESEGRLMGIIASAIGVEEERRKAAQALWEVSKETQSILNSLPNAVLILDENQTVVSANPLGSQLFGGTRTSILGCVLSDIFPAEEVDRIHLLLERNRSGEEPGFCKKDREFELHNRVYRYRCFPVAIHRSARPQTGLVIWDITEEKQLQEQLVQAEKLASLGTMTSGVAHEINNPTQAILGMAEIIVDETDPAKVKEYALDIVGYAQHVASVVRDFVSYARASSRDGEMELDLNQRLTQAVKMVRRGPHFGNVDVTTQFDRLPSFTARRAELDQLFINLISNAVQAMKGKGRLLLATHQQGAKIVIDVSDSGCGIPKVALKKIFDPFFTTKDPGKGTGLGLSIVYKIVAKYGGTIKVDSEEGQGTTFTIEFPVGGKLKGGA